MYNKILLAVDGSEHSFNATQEAIKLASMSENSIIIVMNVVDFSKAKSEVLHSSGSEELNQLRRNKLLPIEEKIKNSNISYEIKILHGEPGLIIVDYVNKEHFELVVVGCRGLNSLQEMVLGSVSHIVARRANCPVLIVK